ncbi:MAG: hypothetical protein A3A51_04395 [Candidatus Levybacteria bacterium RIFCSPLOWO2_01_FULL_39_10]|nr:MAG: hypothetical protein A3A51_04395 [Candidatus Levybacteria bacterium RIFCSPLOWO2_01_FULL_39_10]
MDDYSYNVQRSTLIIAAILILVIVLPLTLLLIKQSQDPRGRAEAPDKLEIEKGVLAGSVEVKQDSQASGGQYVLFGTSQTSTPTPPSNNVGAATDADVGPRPANWSVISSLPSSRVYYMPSSAKTDWTTFYTFINNVPNGASSNQPNYIVFDPSKGTGPVQEYVIPEKLQLQYRYNLIFWGYNAKIRNDGTRVRAEGASSYGTLFEVEFFSENIDILGFELEGLLPKSIAATTNVRNSSMGFPGEYGHGVAIWQAGRVNVVDNWIHHVSGDGIYVTGEYFNYWGNAPTNKIDGSVWESPGPFEFKYNKIQKTGRQGITNNQTKYGFQIHHNLVEDVALGVIDAEDGEDPRRWLNNVHVTDNVFRRFNWHWRGCVAGGFYFGNAITQSFNSGQMNTADGYEIARNWFDGGFRGYGSDVACMCTSGGAVTACYSDGRKSNNDRRNHMIGMGWSLPKKNVVIKDNLVTITKNQMDPNVDGVTGRWGDFTNVDGLTITGNTWAPMSRTFNNVTSVTETNNN